MRTERYFIDFEFHDDNCVIQPISIGIVDMLNRELYIEFDFDEAVVHRTNPWVTQNVLPLLSWERSARIQLCDAALLIVDFVGQPHRAASRTEIQFWAYNAAYDWVCFCKIFGGLINLPKHFQNNVFDLKQRYAAMGRPPHVKIDKGDGRHNALIDARNGRNFAEAMDREVARQLEQGDQ